MSDAVRQFYDQFANDYQLIFADWMQAVERQGEILDAFIRTQLSKDGQLSLLDCSCGIGTQAIGLGQRNYTVHATDISPNSVEHARRNAEEFGVEITFAVADFRILEKSVGGTFDIVISCDNALPHLLTDDDLLVAAQNMHTKLNPGGLLLVSIRDYDQIVKTKPKSDPIRVFGVGKERRITFQVWDWEENAPIYTISHFILTQENGEWQTAQRQTQYRALQRCELTTILENAGFADINWHMPADSGYYQPVVTAHRR
jgi:glycine/sarcosine N-methyltransferase